jgi:hypothetical protein
MAMDNSHFRSNILREDTNKVVDFLSKVLLAMVLSPLSGSLRSEGGRVLGLRDDLPPNQIPHSEPLSLAGHRRQGRSQFPLLSFFLYP